MKPYPEAYKQRARELYKPGVFGLKQVAIELGVPAPTVLRWVNPEYAARQREKSRQLKASYQGVCVDCAGPTKYNGRYDRQVSVRCAACQRAYQLSSEYEPTNKKWSQELLVSRIQEWADKYGQPPSVTDWNPWFARFKLGNEKRARRFLDADGYWPWSTAIFYVFGSWNAAIEAAGFEPQEASGAARRWNGTSSRVRAA